MATARTFRWLMVYLIALAVAEITRVLAPGASDRVAMIVFAPFGMALQLTTVLFAVLPALGLAWFAWHLLFKRRVRMFKLRRIRVRQGRTTNLLAPPPIFGAAKKKADDGCDRSWLE